MGTKTDTEGFFKDKPRLKKVLSGLVSLIVMFLFIGLNFRLFYLIPIAIIIIALLPNSRKNFYKLQAVLPTSKTNGIAMGIVEIEGEVEEIEPLISPYFSQPCVGYLYTIQEERKDSDGDRSWYTIHSEGKTGLFRMRDETGTVLVDGSGLEYYTITIDKQVDSGLKRHTESYLKAMDYRVLIGYADSQEGETIIRKDEHYKVFGIAAPNQISLMNKYKPLLNSFFVTLFFITLVIVLIILN